MTWISTICQDDENNDDNDECTKSFITLCHHFLSQQHKGSENITWLGKKQSWRRFCRPVEKTNTDGADKGDKAAHSLAGIIAPLSQVNKDNAGNAREPGMRAAMITGEIRGKR